jgi:hypothetical protein
MRRIYRSTAIVSLWGDCLTKKEEADLFSVRFGSNTHINSKGILRVGGKELFKLEKGSDDQLLITTEVRDKDGTLLGKIWRNSFAHVHDGYEGKAVSMGGLKRKLLLKRKFDGSVIFEANIKSRSEIEVNGIFNLEGRTIIATKDYLDVGFGKLSNCTFDSCGGDISIS